ncbi:MAG TPA: SdpI family protein [Anaerolineae bacterium]|nr:SdpI family protein [Anaerolineae bacterium]
MAHREGGNLDDRLFLLLLYLGAGLLLAGLAVPLILQKIGPNIFYGFRLPRAFESRETWFAVNKYGGRLLLRVAVLLVLAAVIFYLIPGLSLDDYALLTASVVLVAMVIVVVLTLLYLRSL